jgi:hypothetical protein
VISGIEDDVDAAMFTFISATEMLALVLYPQHTHVQGQYQEQVHEILFGLIYHHFINIAASSQLYLSFHDALHRWIFNARSVYSGISLQASDEILTVILGFGQHGDVAGME